MTKVAVINGPNLNLLGIREPDIYGSHTLSDIERLMAEEADRLEVELRFTQSNHEGELVEAVQACHDWADAIILNPAGYTHSSVVLRDAVVAIRLPTIELHLSNIYARESFRLTNLFSDVVSGTISGFGAMSYILALHAAKHLAEQGSV